MIMPQHMTVYMLRKNDLLQVRHNLCLNQYNPCIVQKLAITVYQKRGYAFFIRSLRIQGLATWIRVMRRVILCLIGHSSCWTPGEKVNLAPP